MAGTARPTLLNLPRSGVFEKGCAEGLLPQRSRRPQTKENHPQIAQMYADKECKAAMISSLSSYPFNLRHLRIDF